MRTVMYQHLPLTRLRWWRPAGIYLICQLEAVSKSFGLSSHREQLKSIHGEETIETYRSRLLIRALCEAGGSVAALLMQAQNW
jgi:hypothetical protein